MQKAAASLYFGKEMEINQIEKEKKKPWTDLTLVNTDYGFILEQWGHRNLTRLRKSAGTLAEFSRKRSSEVSLLWLYKIA